MQPLIANPKKHVLMTVALLLVAALVVGCSDDDDDDNNPTGPGNDVNEAISFEFNGIVHTGTACVLNYFSDDDMSYLEAGGEDWALSLEFPGNGAGTFGDDVTAGSLVFAPLSAFQSGEITINVSSFGGVGNAVTGTFSGTLVNHLDDADIRQITEGTFTAVRSLDVR